MDAAPKSGDVFGNGELLVFVERVILYLFLICSFGYNYKYIKLSFNFKYFFIFGKCNFKKR